jgi:hypothetical protein
VCRAADGRVPHRTHHDQAWCPLACAGRCLGGDEAPEAGSAGEPVPRKALRRSASLNPADNAERPEAACPRPLSAPHARASREAGAVGTSFDPLPTTVSSSPRIAGLCERL